MNIEMRTDYKATNEVLATLSELPREFNAKARRNVLLAASKPLIQSAKSKVKDSTRNHKRYASGSRNKKGKGAGRVIATYTPGNLNRSIGVLPLKKTPDVWVGARVKKSPSGSFDSKTRYDGYYAHMVHEGTKRSRKKNPFLVNAFNETSGAVMDGMKKGAIKIIERYKKKHALK